MNTPAKMGSDPIFTWPDFNAIPADRYAEQRQELKDAYHAVRAHSGQLASNFTEAEQQVQSMPDASPTKWHLAHTTWFFETFILKPLKPDFEWFDGEFCYLFNSYYNAIGSQYPRPRRGLITRPDLEGVWRYRAHVDGEVDRLLESCNDRDFAGLAPTLVLGLNHEQQHQELILTDIKHALYQSQKRGQVQISEKIEPDPFYEAKWLEHKAGRAGIGYAGEGFCFDNELARHEVLLQPFQISDCLITAGEWLAFMEDGGYENPLLWLSDGWFWRRNNDVTAPLYWRKLDGLWHRFTYPCRSGLLATTDCAWTPIDPAEPVRHVSYYEADAFAAWRGARLPREAEWEAAAKADVGSIQKDPGICWEWTQSAYCPYPGFKPTPGLAGEYNGKFMVNQMVLRGGSKATPAHHSRLSYRNFFYPSARWQYTGVRLARDL